MNPEQNENEVSEIIVYRSPHEKMMWEMYKNGDPPPAPAAVFLCFFAFLFGFIFSKVLGGVVLDSFYPYEFQKNNKNSTIAGLIIGLVFCVALLVSLYW